MRGLRATHNPDHTSPKVGGSMRGVEIGFSLPVFWGVVAIKWRSSKFRRLVLEKGSVRGDPPNRLIGLGATKRRGVLSMTERHLGTLPLKDVGKKDPDKQLEGNPKEWA